ncbi:hypothetical protein NEOLEDRAFT_1132477 [Neolentinus lepideus HHB14362 ss-1]|uniref:Vacuolar import and degradation protein n=1 Tax=Neolentinus lepideus HHB14362 ss-1 TaxID=1314782 RepID=A0A165TBB8_9AGAM|nr:hypothetical protein NEOLEDRAFT_1132477 [Neolentinus lepideus HHB14362 ss-1]
MPVAPPLDRVVSVPEQVVSDHTQVQAKTCSSCRTPIPPDGTANPVSVLFDDTGFGDTTIVCRFCRERSTVARGVTQTQEACLVTTDGFGGLGHRIQREDVHDEPDPRPLSRTSTDDSVLDLDADMNETPSSPRGSHSADPEPSQRKLLNSLAAPASKRARTELEFTTSPPSCPPLTIQTPVSRVSGGPNRTSSSSTLTPDPLVDITHLRVRSRGCHSLYPGALFQGTQKSGRNSYDVTVNIVDVDFESSTLCGYLCIKGLTDDWPELTTYFDAEIIGNRYGFRTRDWGATEQDDLSHWSCFPAFRHVKQDMQKPGWTIDERDRGAVFMRWKERFLVPDHRVQDITGASFAGFYYVCVDFNPQSNHQTPRPVPQQMPLTPEFETDVLRAKPDNPTRIMRRESKDGSGRRSWSSRRSRSRGTRSVPRPAATMSGYYFHQNSEPYQQLSLVHVPETSETSFEFR